MYTISTVETYEAFLALENEWENLRLNNNLTLFSSYYWYRCILHSSGHTVTVKPFIVILKCPESGRVVGIFPLQKDKKMHLQGLTSIVNSDTQCFEFICEKKSEQKIIAALFDFLSHLKSINYIELTPVSEHHSPLIDFSINKKFSFLNIQKQSPYLLCDQPFEKILKSKSKKSRQRTRNLINRFNRLGEVSIETLSYLKPNDFEDCAMISRGSWKGATGSAIDSSEKTETFFRAISEAASERDWLRVMFLRVDGKRVAMEYHLREKNIEYALRGDYLTQYQEHSPGRYLDYFIINDLCDEHEIEIYDMCGDQYDYKKKWSQLSQKFYRILWIPNPFVRWLYRIKQMVGSKTQK